MVISQAHQIQVWLITIRLPLIHSTSNPGSVFIGEPLGACVCSYLRKMVFLAQWLFHFQAWPGNFSWKYQYIFKCKGGKAQLQIPGSLCLEHSSWFSLHCTVVWTLAVLNKWLSIYENHVCELRLKKWIWRWSSQLGTLLTVRSNENKAWKKFSLVGDFHPWPLQYRCSALPTEPTSQLGANIGSE